MRIRSRIPGSDIEAASEETHGPSGADDAGADYRYLVVIHLPLVVPHWCRLRAAIPDISDRMLSERLRELEAEGIVKRTVIPETPVRVEYAVTEKGRGLEDAIEAIGKWAEAWLPTAPDSG